MDEIPYQTLMYMNAIVPDYKKGAASDANKATKRMTLWEIADAVGKGASA
jgi:hypothetical protein